MPAMGMHGIVVRLISRVLPWSACGALVLERRKRITRSWHLIDQALAPMCWVAAAS
jgi:hypothetical protein